MADFCARTTRIVFHHRGIEPCCDSSRASRAHSRCCHRPRFLRNRPRLQRRLPAPAAQPNDYSKPETWLCRPGSKDSCAVDLSTTIVAPSGKFKKESFKAARNAPIDCFYVYPTVSLDQTGNSDMTRGPGRAQRHPAAVRALLVGVPRVRAAVSTGHADGAARRHRRQGRCPSTACSRTTTCVDAWNYYLKNDNSGRGVVLDRPLAGLGRADAADPQRDRRQAGAGRRSSPRCCSARTCRSRRARTSARSRTSRFASRRRRSVAWSRTRRFRDTIPPPANSRFGKAQGENMAAACVNPAALGGGSGQLHAYLSNGRFIASSAAAPKPWVTPERKVTTPFVSVPGLLTAECVSNDSGTLPGGARQRRSRTIRAPTTSSATWSSTTRSRRTGACTSSTSNLAMGNLVELVREQSEGVFEEVGPRTGPPPWNGELLGVAGPPCKRREP